MNMNRKLKPHTRAALRAIQQNPKKKSRKRKRPLLKRIHASGLTLGQLCQLAGISYRMGCYVLAGKSGSPRFQAALDLHCPPLDVDGKGRKR